MCCHGALYFNVEDKEIAKSRTRSMEHWKILEKQKSLKSEVSLSSFTVHNRVIEMNFISFLLPVADKKRSIKK